MSPTPTSIPGGNLHVDLLAIHMWEFFFFFFNATTLYKPLNAFVTPKERKAMQKPLVVQVKFDWTKNILSWSLLN